MFKKLTDTTFQMYQVENGKYKSTLFDLIGGEQETKQTKGLAYLFNMSLDFLKNFLAIEKVNKTIKKKLTNNEYKEFMNSDFLKVDAEMISEGDMKIRRDITLTFYYKSKKVFVLIIEAKNIKAVTGFNIEEQLQRYIDPEFFPHDQHVPKVAVALTKYKQLLTLDKFISITWMQIIQTLDNTIQLGDNNTKSLLLKDYYNFITGVDKGMKYYEKEILSVPAGKTFEEINKYHIHACPDTAAYNYKDPLFITFRQRNGGVMEKLYKIEDILVLSPENLSVLNDISESNLPYRERLLAYIKERKPGHGFPKNDRYRFYILSKNENISLKHYPHPEKNNTGIRYYTLSEMLSGRNIVFTNV